MGFSKVRLGTGLAAWAAVFCISLLTATPAFAVANCVNDLQGADDEPGQKDLSKFCSEPASGGFELTATWSFDDLAWTGSNTGDSCGLFDTDGDGNANFALCVTVGGTPAAQI